MTLSACVLFSGEFLSVRNPFVHNYTRLLIYLSVVKAIDSCPCLLTIIMVFIYCNTVGALKKKLGVLSIWVSCSCGKKAELITFV